MRRRIVSLLLVLCLMVGVLPMAGAVDVDNFTDVSKDSWYYDYVEYVTDKEYFIGTTNTTFEPDRAMTRAMFVVVLARYAGVELDGSKSAFDDVAANAWYTGAINWAAENKIVNGYGNGVFGPNEPITRAQMCAIMDRYIKYHAEKTGEYVDEKGSNADLADQATIPAYAKDAVKNCQIYGLINGYTDGTFRPYAYSTRAHVAAILYRLTFLVDNAGGGSRPRPTPTPAPTDAIYEVTLSIDHPVTSFYNGSLMLTADYMVTTDHLGNKTGEINVAELVDELVTGGNAAELKAAIGELLGEVKNSQKTVAVDGKELTVAVDANGVISATASVPVGDLVTSGTSTISTFALLRSATASDDQIMAMLDKLAQGGSVTLDATDMLALETVLDKLGDMDAEAIMNRVNASDNDAMKEALAGMTPEAIESARDDALIQLEAINTEASANGGVVANAEPVMVAVDVDLQAYLTKVNTKYNATDTKDRALEKFCEELGVAVSELDSAVVTAYNACYAASNPAEFVGVSGADDLVLLTAADYYDQLYAYVTAGCDLWAALAKDEAFYTAKINAAKTRADNYDALDVTVNDALAAVLGTTADITNTVEAAEFVSVVVTVDNGTYDSVVDLLTEKLTGTAYADVLNQIPATAPSALGNFFGDYCLTISVEEVQ